MYIHQGSKRSSLIWVQIVCNNDYQSPSADEKADKICLERQEMVIINYSFRVNTLCPSQSFFSHVGMFTGLNQYKAEGKVLCSRTQHSASGEARTSLDLKVSTQLLSQLAPRL